MHVYREQKCGNIRFDKYITINLGQGSASGSGGPQPDRADPDSGLRDGFQKTSGSGLRSRGPGISGLSPMLARFMRILKIEFCRTYYSFLLLIQLFLK